ncbi:MAG: cation transporting ATPase C-terminal domain-containing protein, partial [Bacilli bacterium]|nr:cation transporting ATPase C-terminal domain-containing protein [Bacilli bacterium]
ADEKESDIMKRKPRKQKESLFAKGGIPIMIGYGVLIALITLTAFFAVPIIDGGIELKNIPYVFNEVCRVLNDEPSIRMTAQTCAFCTLGIGELFHMLGMTSTTKSFIHNFKSRNWILWVAFVLGLGLQFAVVMVPGLNSFFKCSQLDANHWLMIGILSIIPLVVHEIVALILFVRSVFFKYR